METVFARWVELERKFITARTPENLLLTGRFLLVGAGGVGTWMAIMLTLHADPGGVEITIIDDDRLEPVNMNRLPFPVAWFLEGKPKVVALEEYLPLLRPSITVKGIVERAGPELLDQLVPHHDVVIDAVDNVEAIELIASIAAKHRKPRLSLHYDGLHGTVEWSPTGAPVGWSSGLNQQGYTTPSTAVTPAALAVVGVRILQERPSEPIAFTFEL